MLYYKYRDKTFEEISKYNHDASYLDTDFFGLLKGKPLVCRKKVTRINTSKSNRNSGRHTKAASVSKCFSINSQ